MTPPVIGGEGHADVAASPNSSAERLAGDLYAFPAAGSGRESIAATANVLNQAILTTQRALLVPFGLIAGDRVSTIRFVSGTQAAVGPTHQQFGFYDLTGKQYCVTSDDTSTAWAASTSKALPVVGVNVGAGGVVNAAGTWIVPATGNYYCAIVVVAGTVPSLYGLNNPAAFGLAIAFGTNQATDVGLNTLPVSLTPGTLGSGGATPYASVT